VELITVQPRARVDEPRPWREPGATLLISCYELGHQPVGVAQPLGYLEQAGYVPAVLDVAAEAFDARRAAQARFIGISVPMHTALRLGVRVAEMIRAVNPSAHICIYGLYASLNAEFLLSHVADSVIGGEYETALVQMVAALEGGKDWSNLPGVSRRGQIVPPLVQRVAANAPVPRRSGLPPLTQYAHLEHRGAKHVVGYVEASRGCLHTCRHCPIVPVYEGRFVLMPEQMVLQDIRQQVAQGATHITFGDPDFLNGPGHSLSILRAMHAEFPALTYDVTAKIEHLLKRRTLMPDLAALGCLFVISAVESFSDVVLAHLNKGHTAADVLAALDIVRDAGMTLRPSLVAFTPWTTLEDYVGMFDRVVEYGLIEAIDPVQYAIRLLVPPGSALLAEPDQPWSLSKIVGPLDQAGFQYPWIHPDPRMDALYRDVSSAVEEAGRLGEDPEDTFFRLRLLAYRAAGREASFVERTARLPVDSRPPRMSEPWFCCAEPTRDQFIGLQPTGEPSAG
jgi:radical SAM superfamily enzyme YgiQ (UPF0313 family)